MEENVTTNTEFLEVMLKEVPADEKAVKRGDFRELRAVYICTAENGSEEFCLWYSPGPGGTCTRRDCSGSVTICRGEVG